MPHYNHKNCQSLFGYAASVHIRSGGQCQLCGCGGNPLDFDLWRQMTVEYLIGKSQGGYLNQIHTAVSERFPDLPPNAHDEIARRLDAANTVTACSFCNSTTSRNEHSKSMTELLNKTSGSADEVVSHIASELQDILKKKQCAVKWKIESVREAFEKEVRAVIDRSHTNYA